MKKKLIRSTALIIIFIIGLGLFIYPKASDLKYNLAQSSLKAETKSSSETGKGIYLPKDTVAKIVIPKINLEAYVLEETTQNVLAKGPVHYEETPMPGQIGNSAIAGHRTMHGHPFRDLNKLEKNDKIIIYTQDEQFSYRILQVKTVKPTNLSVLEETENMRITLITCHPIGSARERLFVVANSAEG